MKPLVQNHQSSHTRHAFFSLQASLLILLGTHRDSR